MNQIQVVEMLNSLSIPSYYGFAPVGTEIPFLIIHSEQPDNFTADNTVYVEKWNFRIDLYTRFKELTLETEIKELLNTNGITWEKTEEYISNQEVWEVEFSFQVLGNEEPEQEG